MDSAIRVSGMSLICPLCKGKIKYSDKNCQDIEIVCLSCLRIFPQKLKAHINLLPKVEMNEGDANWQERQTEMELWYKVLLPDTYSTISLFEHDYEPFRSYFAKLSGDVLDLGGGVGLVRHYLPKETNYIVVDPSVDWLSSDWSLLSDTFPCLSKRFNFILGAGEYLMFDDDCFDSVLSLWSINHVNNPSKVFQEVQRVLKPGGKFFVIFEDMEPSWSDLFCGSMRYYFRFDDFLRLVKTKIRTTFTNKKWVVQADHIFITDNDVQNWIIGRFEQTAREWKSTYLTFEFVKI